jgi:DNA-binding beta-propeller fold protein YncE
MPETRHPGAVLAAALAAALTLAACGGGGHAGSPQPHGGGNQQRNLTPAAEPGTAPKLATKPAGTVVTLPGGKPWGITVDHADHLVALALRKPPRLGLVDTTTHQVQTVKAPGTARHLNLAKPGGPLLYPSESKHALYKLTLPSGKISSRVSAGKVPHDAVRAGEKIFFSDEFGGYLGVVRPGKPVRKLDKPVQPGGVNVAGGRVGVIDVQANVVDVYDTTTLKLLASLPAGKGPDHIAAIGRGRVAVSDVRGHQVITFDLTGKPHRLGRASVPGRPFNIASDPHRRLVYASLSNTNKVTQFHVRPDGALAEPVTLPTVRQPNSLAVDPRTGTVYVAGYKPARLDVIARRAFG